MRTLNVGCGADPNGTHRVDFDANANVTEVASALALPYKDDVFDEVFSANMLEHMGNPLQFLQEGVRVLKPGGKLVVVTDHAGYVGYHFVGFRPADNHRCHGPHGDNHFMLFSEGHMRNLCEAAGLEVQSVELFTKFPQGWIAKFLRLVARPLAEAQIRVEATKPVAKKRVISLAH